MKLVIRAEANSKYLSAQDIAHVSVQGRTGDVIFPDNQRTVLAKADAVGGWELFDPLVQVSDGSLVPLDDYIDQRIKAALPVPVPPEKYDPNVRQPWPRLMPPDIDTTDENEVINRVDWCLQNYDDSDDRSYWVDVIQGRKEHLAQPGWTKDGYWRTEKIAKGEGVNKGYVWPPK